jgi:hypothetical protein
VDLFRSSKGYMMNQRAGKTHLAAMTDDGGSIPLGSLIKFVRSAQDELEHAMESDAALRFEIFGDFLEQDVANGIPFKFTTKAIGL